MGLEGSFAGIGTPVPGGDIGVTPTSDVDLPVSTPPADGSTISQSTQALGSVTPAANSPKLQQPDPLVTQMVLDWMFKLMTQGNLHFDSNGNDPELQGVQGVQAKNPSELLAMVYENKLRELTSAVLDKWIESLQEQKKLVEEYLKSPKYLQKLYENSPQYFAKEEGDLPGKPGLGASDFNDLLIGLPKEQRDKLILNKLEFYDGLTKNVDNYIEHVRSSTDPSSPDSLPFMTSSLMIGGAGMSTVGAVDSASTSLVGVKMIQDLMSQFNSAAPQLYQYQGDNAATLGLIGALFMNGVVYNETGQNFVKSAVLGSKPQDLNFAKSAAASTMNLLNNEEFQNFVVALLIQPGENMQNLSEQRRGELLAPFKLTLLSAAIALLYYVQFKGFTGTELTGLIKDPSQLADPKFNNIRPELQKLLDLVNVQLTYMPSARDEILGKLGQYFDGMDKNNLADMLKPMNALKQAFPEPPPGTMIPAAA